MNNESPLFQHITIIARRINEIVMLEAENAQLRKDLKAALEKLNAMS
jgi:hypothetical protein